MKKSQSTTTLGKDSSLVEKSPVSECMPTFGDEESREDERLKQLYQDWLERQEYYHLGNSHYDLHY